MRHPSPLGVTVARMCWVTLHPACLPPSPWWALSVAGQGPWSQELFCWDVGRPERALEPPLPPPHTQSRNQGTLCSEDCGVAGAGGAHCRERT